MEVDSKPVAVVKSILSATGLTSSRGATPSGTRPGTPMRNNQEPILPEEDIYLTLLVIVYLLDANQIDKVRVCRCRSICMQVCPPFMPIANTIPYILQGKALVDNTIIRLGNMNRRTLDQLAARVYFYYARLHEIAGDADELASIRP